MIYLLFIYYFSIFHFIKFQTTKFTMFHFYCKISKQQQFFKTNNVFDVFNRYNSIRSFRKVKKMLIINKIIQKMSIKQYKIFQIIFKFQTINQCVIIFTEKKIQKMIEILKKIKQNGKRGSLKIKVKTWERDTYQLYDYNSDAFLKNTHFVQSKTTLQVNRKLGKFHIAQIDNQIDGEQNFEGALMGHVEPAIWQNGYSSFIYRPAKKENNSNTKSTWDEGLSSSKIISSYMVFQKDRNPGIIYKLGINDVIRFGIKSFRVSAISTTRFENQQNFLPSKNEQNILFIEKPSVGACKICLMEQDPDNQMISPCNCKGSCSCVHISCLRKWVISKGNIKMSRFVQSLDFNKMNCQICKKNYPEKIIINGRQELLYHLSQPQNPYLVLESVTQNKCSETLKSIFIVAPKHGQAVTIGRSSDCQIRLQDKTVSKMHACITRRNNDFYLADNGSKFGTLIKINGPIDLKRHNLIQAGRFLFDFSQN